MKKIQYQTSILDFNIILLDYPLLISIVKRNADDADLNGFFINKSAKLRTIRVIRVPLLAYIANSLKNLFLK